MKNIWTKQKDGWAVWGPDVKDFATVTVSKRDGTSQTVDLGAVKGVLISKGSELSGCSYAFPRKDQSDRAAKTQSLCAECGKPGTLVPDDEDGLLKHWKCCDIPPEKGRY
jgi:hypothetical protein